MKKELAEVADEPRPSEEKTPFTNPYGLRKRKILQFLFSKPTIRVFILKFFPKKYHNGILWLKAAYEEDEEDAAILVRKKMQRYLRQFGLVGVEQSVVTPTGTIEDSSEDIKQLEVIISRSQPHIPQKIVDAVVGEPICMPTLGDDKKSASLAAFLHYDNLNRVRLTAPAKKTKKIKKDAARPTKKPVHKSKKREGKKKNG